MELATKVSLEEQVEVNDSNQNIKCISCDFNARNTHLLEKHMENEHQAISDNVCNPCNQIFKTNEELEIHLASEHTGEIDCSTCKAVFKTEADVLDHSNNCSEVISPNICTKCERELVSKAFLKKHMKGCKEKKKQLELCRNGEQCS